MEDNRQNPDQLLKAVQKAERNPSGGHLKIFFGYAAGVGKPMQCCKLLMP